MKKMSDDIAPTVLLRAPNFLKVQTEEYNKEIRNEGIERKSFDRATAIMRWRYKRDSQGEMLRGEDGQPLLESNARLLKWSDGSYQLIVGDNVFNSNIVGIDNSFAFKQTKTSEMPGLISDGESEATCLSCVAPLSGKIVAQPLSLDSEAHARMSIKMSHRYQKAKQIAVKDEDLDKARRPEEDQLARAREEESRLRKERKQRMLEAESYSGGSGTTHGRPSMSAEYLNAYDESTSVAAIKRQLKQKPRSRVATKRIRSNNRRGGRGEEEEEEEDGESLGSEDDYDEDEEEETAEDRAFIDNSGVEDGEGLVDTEDESDSEGSM